MSSNRCKKSILAERNRKKKIIAALNKCPIPNVRHDTSINAIIIESNVNNFKENIET